MLNGRLTHLNSYHRANSRLTVFAGFEMPLWYSGISVEHLAVRNQAGLFDVTHMGRFEIRGKDAAKFLNFILPSDLARFRDGRAFYSVICNEKGGIIDDIVTLRIDEEHYIVVGNAVNRERDFQLFAKNSTGFEVEVNDISDNVAMFALQGPKAQAVLEKSCSQPLSQLNRFSHASTSIAGVECLVSRTGYTGEDGFEIMIPNCRVDQPSNAISVWSRILSDGEADGLMSCGLGARDTLRLEAGYCLFGQDIDESTNPFEADLGWVVSLDKGDFLGKGSLLLAKGAVSRIRSGLVMKSTGIPRPSSEVMKSGSPVGKVTSGTFSPLLKKGIGMCYVPLDVSGPEKELEVSIRDRLHEANLAKFPLYDPYAYGWRRIKS